MTKFEYDHRLVLLPCHLLLCLSVICSCSAEAPAAAGHRPGCPAKCGDVDIPFPFGIGEQCALDGFQLGCNRSIGSRGTGSTSSKPFWGDFEVMSISVPDGKVRVKTLISSLCYDPATNLTTPFEASSDFTNSGFWISDADNKIVVIGCYTLAYMMSSSYVIGCLSRCDDALPLQNGSCSGNGCCQADVPKDITYYESYFNERYNGSVTWRQQDRRCGYMAVMEKAALDFRPSFVTSTVFNDTNNGKVPVILNWLIAQVSCRVARQNMSTYACVSSNSQCLDSTGKQPGYRCRCRNGYEGNPYITGGCQDIDECLGNSNLCPFGVCVNTPGGYNCPCHPGNSTINGVCVPIQKPSRFPALPVVGASVGLVIIVIAIACACLIRERKKSQKMKENYFRQHGGLLLFEEMKSKQANSFKIFTKEELQKATDMFSAQRIVGRGGNGTVYRGLLEGNDLEVAVKRCMTIDEKQKAEFGKEMLILSQINHRNIVKLLGCCLEVEVPMLVYEFIPNGTLFQLIHGSHGQRLSLAARLEIAHESADALAYLHSCASPPILHGDVKSSNILIDADRKAKVSDFGTSILGATDESQFATFMQGTCGYLDPEYVQTCRMTYKSDVYSFGVVLLELLTRKKPVNLFAAEHEKSLSVVFLSAMKENKVAEILDEHIKDEEDNARFIQEIAELAKQCLEMYGENRPSMREVAEKLGGLRKGMHHHPWGKEAQEDTESLLGEPSSMASSTVSTEKIGITGLQSGR